MTAEARTMANVQSVIDEHVAVLGQKPLIRALNESSDIEDLRAIAPHGYFYVLAFQDMLRIAYEKIEDPMMREVALSLMDGDTGHDKWFLSDMSKLGTSRDIPWLFGAEHQPVRDMVYVLVSELLKASTDSVRLAFPLILEGGASIFFAAMVGLYRRSNFGKSLTYFAPVHQEAEEAHEVFSEESQKKLTSIEFSQATYEEACAMIRRCFDHFEGFADHLEGQRLQA